MSGYDRMSEIFGYDKKPIKSLSPVRPIRSLAPLEKKLPEGKIEIRKYRNYYDVNNTITTAQAANPNDEDHPNYNRERVFEVLERNAETIRVTNDGNDTLYIIVSHEGGQNFSRERPIYAGDIKEFYNVYELRLRSPTAGLPYRVTEYKIDVNCCPTPGINFFTGVALGDVPGAKAFYKLGSSNVIPTTTFMILSNVTSNTFISNFPPVPQQLQVVSTSANDAAAGTGTQQVTIDYLTDPSSATKFTRFSEIVTLNGVTPVNTIAKNISRIEQVHVSRVGTTSVSQGDISIQSVGGATTFEKIAAGENVSRTSVHFVPNGYKCVITDLLFGSVTAGGTRFSFTTTPEDAAGNVVRVGQHEIAIGDSGHTHAYNTPIFLSNPDNKRISFAITVRGVASNQQGSGSFTAIDIPL